MQEENEKALSSSYARQEFKHIYDSAERTSLGNIKKISIKHHIELMNYILSNR